MKFDVKNRFTDRVQFTAEIECNESATYSVKLSLAMKWGHKHKIDLSNANLRSADLCGVDLRSANLSGTDLRGADFRSADLRGADLSGVDLSRVDLRSVDLRGAVLSNADLHRANLSNANLSRADLSNANLHRADLRGANLSRANLRGADLCWTDLSGADLSRANLRDAKYGDGIPMTVEPLQLLGLRWPVFILDNHIKIGCQLHAIDKWEKFTNFCIEKMDPNALEFWRAHRETILTLARQHELGDA